MSHPIKNLIQALQELTQQPMPSSQLPGLIDSSRLEFAPEIERYLDLRARHAQRTQDVSIGSY
jgi:hypothetical protein